MLGESRLVVVTEGYLRSEYTAWLPLASVFRLFPPPTTFQPASQAALVGSHVSKPTGSSDGQITVSRGTEEGSSTGTRVILRTLDV